MKRLMLLSFYVLNEIQKWPGHVFKIFQDLCRASNQCICNCAVKKKALCDVFMLSDVQCTFTVNLYKCNSVNLIFSYDNWIFTTIVKFGTTVVLP